MQGDKNMELDLTALQPGIYIVKYGAISKKLIIQ